MLADISGFTKFSGEMCSKGAGGLDDLREATNGFLGHCVKLVYEYKGDGMVPHIVYFIILLKSSTTFCSDCLCWRCFDLCISR
jgi:hypothetical protein